MNSDTMANLTFALVLFVAYLYHQLPAGQAWDPDQIRDVPAMIKSRGYICETHFVKTQDSYILTVHRIVNPMYNPRGRPIILQHGLLSSGRDFIINAPGGGVDELLTGSRRTVGNNLGFELAKHGYDVWLTNSRGNTYGRNHTILNPDKGKLIADYLHVPEIN